MLKKFMLESFFVTADNLNEFDWLLCQELNRMLLFVMRNENSSICLLLRSLVEHLLFGNS